MSATFETASDSEDSKNTMGHDAEDDTMTVSVRGDTATATGRGQRSVAVDGARSGAAGVIRSRTRARAGEEEVEVGTGASSAALTGASSKRRRVVKVKASGPGPSTEHRKLFSQPPQLGLKFLVQEEEIRELGGGRHAQEGEETKGSSQEEPKGYVRGQEKEEGAAGGAGTRHDQCMRWVSVVNLFMCVGVHLYFHVFKVFGVGLCPYFCKCFLGLRLEDRMVGGSNHSSRFASTVGLSIGGRSAIPLVCSVILARATHLRRLQTRERSFTVFFCFRS